MFVILCGVCGRAEQWGEGKVPGETQIDIADKSVFCSCGHSVVEEEGKLKEYDVSPELICAEPSSDEDYPHDGRASLT